MSSTIKVSSKLLRVAVPQIFHSSLTSTFQNMIPLGKNRIYPFEVSRSVGQKITFQLKKMRARSLSIRIPVIFMASLFSGKCTCYDFPQYFKITLQSGLFIEEDFFLTKTVHDDISCTTTCNANNHCHSVLFDKIQKSVLY